MVAGDEGQRRVDRGVARVRLPGGDVVNDLVEFLRARLDGMERALDEYREHRERGDHVNYEGADPAGHDEYDSCARCIATAEAIPYRDVAFGLADVDAQREVIRLYKDTLATIAMFKEHGREATHHEVAAESYLNVIRLQAAVHKTHPDYRPERRP
jgi:hypothetical protein